LEREKVIEFVKNLKLSEHAVLIYTNPKDKQDTLFTYLKAGLDKGEAAVYVASEETPEEIRQAMQRFGIDVDQHERDGALKIVDYRNWYLMDGKFDVSRSLSLWRKLLEESKSRSFQGLRVTGEASWFLERNMVDELVEYERALHRVLDIPMTAICAYNSKLLVSKEEWFNLLIQILNMHSTAIMLGQKGLGATTPDEILVTMAL